MGRFLFVLRIVAGAVFAVSGYQKLIQPHQNFLYAVQSFEFLPAWAESAVAVVFPWFELFGGTFLVFGLWTRHAVWSLWLANTGFIVVLAQAILRKLPITDCGCFGDMVRLPLPAMLGLDAALWTVFGLLAVFENDARRFSLDGRGRPS